MTLFPAGIEIFKDKKPGPACDAFSRARVKLHDKLAGLSCPKAVFQIPRGDLFSQVGIVVDELLEIEDYGLSGKEQTILTRVLAYDLMESQARKMTLGRVIN